MDTYKCNVCEYIYQDSRTGNRFVSFQSLPEEWKCPECGSGKKNFVLIKKDKDNVSKA